MTLFLYHLSRSPPHVQQSTKAKANPQDVDHCGLVHLGQALATNTEQSKQTVLVFKPCAPLCPDHAYVCDSKAYELHSVSLFKHCAYDPSPATLVIHSTCVHNTCCDYMLHYCPLLA